jgi:hypothetical protein
VWQTRPGDCEGRATLTGARAIRYDVSGGRKQLLRFRLRKRALRALRRAGTSSLTATATNSAPGGGTGTRLDFTIRAPRQ